MGMLGMAFLGGSGALALVLFLAGRRGRTDVQTLLLAGVVIGAMLSAVLSLVLYSAGEDTNQILRWLMGMMTPMYWPKVAALLAALVFGLAILIPQGKKLNALAVSEDSARRLGVDTRRLKMTILLMGSAMAAVTVGTIGVIGFLGLVAPHISRRMLGVDWRYSLLGAGAVGAVILIFADILSQRLIPGAELPVGIITAVLGAPFLLVLMRRESL
jgi:iron complex transport system permease protein